METIYYIKLSYNSLRKNERNFFKNFKNTSQLLSLSKKNYTKNVRIRVGKNKYIR
jgi:hypothetical protein